VRPPVRSEVGLSGWKGRGGRRAVSGGGSYREMENACPDLSYPNQDFSFEERLEEEPVTMSAVPSVYFI